MRCGPATSFGVWQSSTPAMQQNYQSNVEEICMIVDSIITIMIIYIRFHVKETQLSSEPSDYKAFVTSSELTNEITP
jgi:hypothetical protein